MEKEKRTYQFQKNAPNSTGIEALKNRWADNDLSPNLFYWGYFKKYSDLTYREFCELINIWESVTAELKAAINDFWKASK